MDTPIAYITDMVRMYVFETLVPNDAKDLTDQVRVKPDSDDSVPCGAGAGAAAGSGWLSCNAMNAEHILRQWVG